jgi:hypothetical protein
LTGLGSDYKSLTVTPVNTAVNLKIKKDVEIPTPVLSELAYIYRRYESSEIFSMRLCKFVTK